MTHNIKMEERGLKKIIKRNSFIIVIVILIYLTAFKSEETKEYAIYGMKLCYMNIIPTLFPFMIFSDILMCAASQSKSRILKKEYALPMLMGILCGFPIGAICVKKLYYAKKITKEKAELLLPVCSVPSLAFITSGVGGMLNNLNDGLLLWFCVILSSLITFLILRKKDNKINKTSEITEQNFDFVGSVKNCGISMISICSFIIFFSVINGLACSYIKNEYLSYIVSGILEVGNACFLISKSCLLPHHLKLMLLGFLISFSGLSVFMQILSVTGNTEISCKKYIFIKIFQSFLCLIILMLILTLKFLLY